MSFDPNDFRPFWIGFPQFPVPSYPPRQSAEESWRVYDWLPFWQSLTDQQRTDYLDHWSASEDWRCAIDTFDHTPDPEIDELLGIESRD